MRRQGVRRPDGQNRRAAIVTAENALPYQHPPLQKGFLPARKRPVPSDLFASSTGFQTMSDWGKFTLPQSSATSPWIWIVVLTVVIGVALIFLRTESSQPRINP